MKMSDIIKRRDSLSELVSAIKFNHNLGDDDSVVITLPQVDGELDRYKHPMTQLTLPHRFGMYKTPTKDVPKTTEVELEDPQDNFIDSTSSILSKNPNHKVRGIFD